MTDSRSPETQQELFPSFSPGEIQKPDRFPGVNKTQKPILFSTSTEQIILAGILFILFSCFIFFLGVLRGKSLEDISAPVVTPIRVSVVRQTVQPVSQPSPAATAPVVTAPSNALAYNATKPYTIQLVTYKKKELAEKETALLRKSGYYSSIISSGDYYVVCVGQYANIDEAKKDLRLFNSRYKGCFLRRR